MGRRSSSDSSTMNSWKRPLLSSSGLQPMGCPQKRPRLACLNPPALNVDCLSKTFDLTLHVYVSGFFLQDMLRFYTLNLLPFINKHEIYVESMAHDKVTRIINTFLQCEWSKGTIPLLNANVSLTATTAADAATSGVWNPTHSLSEIRGKTAKGKAASRESVRKRKRGKNRNTGPWSSRSVEGSRVLLKNENQYVDVVKTVKNAEMCAVRDQETQTSTQPIVEIKRCEQSVQTILSSELTHGKHDYPCVSFKDCSVQTVATSIPYADHLPSPQMQSCDNPDPKDAQTEEAAVQTLGDRPMKKQHSKTAPTQEQPDSSQQMSNKLTKIQVEDEPVQKELQKSDCTQTVANNCFPLKDFGQNQTQQAMDKQLADETTQSGNVFSTDANHSGNAPSEDTAQHVGYPHSERNIPLRITSVHDLDLRKECSPQRRAQNLHCISSLIQNSENAAETVGGQPNNNPPPSNFQGIPQFKINLPGNMHYGLNPFPNPCFQTVAMNTALPRNGPCHSNIPTWPMPQSSSLNWTTKQQFPPQQLATTQQGTNTLPVIESIHGQGTGLQRQVPMTHTNTVQPVMGQSLRSPNQRNNPAQSRRNLIQLTGNQFNDAAKRTESQVWVNSFSVQSDEARPAIVGGPCCGLDPAGCSATAGVPSVGTDWKSPDQSSVATMANLAQGGLSMPVTLSGNYNGTKPTQQTSSVHTTGFQSSSFAVNMLPSSEESGKSPSSLVQKPGPDSVVQFSDTSALAQYHVHQRQEVTSTGSEDSIPGLHGDFSAAQGMDQAQYSLYVESVKQTEVNTAMQMDCGMIGVTDKLTPSDQTSTNIHGSKPALEGNPTPKEDNVSRSLSEPPQPTDSQKQKHHEQTVGKQSACSLQKPTRADGYTSHMPSLDEIPLPGEQPHGQLHTRSKMESPKEQTLVKNDVGSSSMEPEKSVSDTNQILHKEMDTACESASAQQKTSHTQSFSGRIPSLDDIPLPDEKVQNSLAHKAKTGEVTKPSDEQLETNTLTPVTHAREETQTCEKSPTERGQLETIVSQIQMIVGQLTEAQASPKTSPSQGSASPKTSPSQGSASPGTDQAQNGSSVGSSPEKTLSKGLCSSLQGETSSALPSAESSSSMCNLEKASVKHPSSQRFMPYGVRSKKRTAERSAQKKDTNRVVEALVMHEIPKLMHSHSNLSTEAIQEQCSRLITRYSSKSLDKGEKASQSTATKSVIMKNSWTLTSRPQRVNRRLMTDTILMRESSTITNIIGRREMTTLTDNLWMKDASTLARRFKPAISRSSQTSLLGMTEVGTITEPVPCPVKTEQGMVKEHTEHDKTTLMTALATTQHHTTSHLTASQLISCQKNSRPDPLEQCKALVQKVSDCASKESTDNKVEDLGDISQQPPGDDGTVRITIKVKIGKGSNIRLAS